MRGEVVAGWCRPARSALEPFESELREPVDLAVPAEAEAEGWRRRKRRKAEIELDLADEDPPELIEDGRIDLGAVAAEFLALGLDPYPRKPGVSSRRDRDGADEGRRRPSRRWRG